MTRDALRRQLRIARQALPPEVRAAAAEAAASLIAKHPQYHNAQHISVYMAVDNELDPTPLVRRALADRKKVFLPGVPPTNDQPLMFLPYAPDTKMTMNRLRIMQPAVAGGEMPPRGLHLVMVPLVAFDTEGQRLGMGGGFYDRSFAFLKDGKIRQPMLIGMAYECQKVKKIPAEPWDVPLAGVVTEQQFYAFSN
jgi:5-formyltetrahydrofolate cyclo-ligase